MKMSMGEEAEPVEAKEGPPKPEESHDTPGHVHTLGESKEEVKDPFAGILGPAPVPS